MTRILIVFCFLLQAIYLSSCAPAVIAAAGSAGAVAAEDRKLKDNVNDKVIWTGITNAYAQNNIDSVVGDIDVKVFEGRVLLLGKVKSQHLKDKAEEYAWKENGVREVINELKVGHKSGDVNVSDYSKDAWITTQIKSKLLADGNIKSMNYEVKTIDRVVYLLGIAQNSEELHKATDIARRTKYVERVISHVRLKDSTYRNN